MIAPLALLVAASVAALADDPPPPSAARPLDLVAAMESAMVEAIARAEPSVVAIAREKSADEETTAVRGRPAGPRPTQPGLNTLPIEDLISYDYGSGVVVGDQGQILTAYHVVRGASRLIVKAAGRQVFEAEIVGADPRSDLAVIAPRVEPGARPPSLKPIPLGDAGTLRKGSFLLALGNPFNAARDGAASASWGILANVARRLERTDLDQGSTVGLRHYPILLQLDAKLNLGMSGGAVVNLKGELVGLTTGVPGAAGFDSQAGYAVPIDRLIRRVVEALEAGKEVEYGFLGIRLDDTNNTNRVVDVTPGTPAGEGGIQSGDEILSVEGIAVADADSLALAIGTQPVGEPVRLRIRRQGRELDKEVILAKYPVSGPIIATSRPAPWRGLRVDFTSILAGTIMAPGVDRLLAQGGVTVVDVVSNSPADLAGLKKGQIITQVDGRAVRSPTAFAEAVASKEGPVVLTTDLGRVTVGK